VKSDSDRIRTFLKGLSHEDWVERSERRWWPNYLCHYTDIQNAARILSSGFLLSRQHLEDSGGIPVSSGSDEVLAGTPPWIKNCVRLYFRPKTPTQFHAEGVKSFLTLSASKFPDAHCPVPVFFLFDSAEILCRIDSLFSDRGLASNDCQIMSTARELASMEWKKIYHLGAFDSSRPEESDIASRRMAEVIVPGNLDMKSLKWIYCRSEAEKDTLLHLLTHGQRPRYESRILATARNALFYRQHTYLETVRLDSNAAHLSFFPDTRSIGPFKVQVNIRSDNGIRQYADNSFTFQRGGFQWNLNTGFEDYVLELHLDEHLVYQNRYIELDDIPF